MIREALESVSAPGRAYRRLKKAVRKPVDALRKEAKVGPVLHEEVLAALERMKEENAGLEKALDEAYAFAVLPSIGKASAVVGGAYGKGEVFRRGRVVGYAAVVQVTIGVQLGGETSHMLVVFHDREAFKRYKEGHVKFAAAASAVLIKAGADASRAFGSGTSVFVFSEGGLLIQASIGAQKLIFRKAALGRLRTSEKKKRAANGEDEEELAEGNGEDADAQEELEAYGGEDEELGDEEDEDEEYEDEEADEEDEDEEEYEDEEADEEDEDDEEEEAEEDEEEDDER